MLPTFFIVGAAKAGTTALYSYLDLHPEVHMSPRKEPDFFADPNGYLPFGRISSLNQYERLFDSDAPSRGEASHTYSIFPIHEGVPDRIHKLVPDARLIYLVRDPIERAKAWYLQNASWRSVATPQEEIGDVNDPYNEYIAGGKYMEQIGQYMPLFDRRNLLVVEQGDLRLKRRETLTEIFSFIGVSPDYWTPEFDEAHNLSSDRVHIHRSIWRVARSKPAQAAIGILPEGARTGFRRVGKSALGSRIPEAKFPESLLRECGEAFRADVDALREFTGRDLAGWSL